MCLKSGDGGYCCMSICLFLVLGIEPKALLFLHIGNARLYSRTGGILV